MHSEGLSLCALHPFVIRPGSQPMPRMTCPHKVEAFLLLDD